MGNSAQQAPDSHWLLVKQYWIPIERRLSELDTVGVDAREKIDNIGPQLSPGAVTNLHYLRKTRNAVIHDNTPLVNSARWEAVAQQALNELNQLAVGEQAVASTGSAVIGWLVVLLLGGAGVAYFMQNYYQVIKHFFLSVPGLITVGALLILL